MKKVLLYFLFFCAYLTSSAQTITSADIYLGLRKLNVLGSVLYIAAHPDDENTRLIAYLSKDRLYRTGYLALTRGDGGQNLIGDEQGIALGLIRTQELLAARKIDGGEQFFTRAYDFGFSKTPEETFTKWDKEKILSDVVWVIRNFQPDVIITRFPTTGEGGHGHHTASAILANEAFTAAANPNRFPEQLKYVQPWQAKRILLNGFNFNNNNAGGTRSAAFSFDVGGYNAVLGRSYGEIAAEGRSQHKSQGFGSQGSRGEAMEAFNTTGGTAPVKDLLDDVDISWKRVKGGEAIMQLVQKAIESYDFVKPQNTIPQLTKIYNALIELPSSYWREKKLEEVKELMVWCSGLWMEATTNVQYAVQGDSLRINFNFNNRNGAPISLRGVSVGGLDTTINVSLGQNKNLVFNKTLLVPNTKRVSQPYWLERKMQEGMFTIEDQTLIGLPQTMGEYVAKFNFNIDGNVISFIKPVQYKYAHPVKGEIYQPLFVIPALTIASNPDLMIFKKGEQESKTVAVELVANRKLSMPELSLEMQSENLKLNRKDSSVTMEKNTAREYTFKIDSRQLKTNEELLGAVAKYRNSQPATATSAFTGIHYDHIPEIRYFFTDKVNILNLDLKTVGKRIGYIVGAGDKVPEALEQMGYEVTLLSDKELIRNHLSQFDAIITGVRAYNTNEWMNNHYEKLMQYVAEGGNLIVQYNTSSNIGPVRAKIGPYNFNINRNRVTDENAAVTFLKPEHAALNFPNKITQDDFKGWVQERSIYHAGGVDSKFEKILGMSDKGENSDDGSLVIAQHGKGYFTYTGLVFFRELPAGVPGAYRLLANLIALNNKKTF